MNDSDFNPFIDEDDEASDRSTFIQIASDPTLAPVAKALSPQDIEDERPPEEVFDFEAEILRSEAEVKRWRELQDSEPVEPTQQAVTPLLPSAPLLPAPSQQPSTSLLTDESFELVDDDWNFADESATPQADPSSSSEADWDFGDSAIGVPPETAVEDDDDPDWGDFNLDELLELIPAGSDGGNSPDASENFSFGGEEGFTPGGTDFSDIDLNGLMENVEENYSFVSPESTANPFAMLGDEDEDDEDEEFAPMEDDFVPPDDPFAVPDDPFAIPEEEEEEEEDSPQPEAADDTESTGEGSDRMGQIKAKLREVLAQIKAELNGGDSPPESPNQSNQDAGDGESSSGGIFSKVFSPYVALAGIIAGLLVSLLQLLGAIPAIGKIFTKIASNASLLRIISMILPVVLILGVMYWHGGGKFSTSQGDVDFPDGGSAKISKVIYSNGKAEVTIENTGDVIAEVTPSVKVYGTRLSANPLRFFYPEELGSCSGKSVKVEIESSKKTVLKCEDFSSLRTSTKSYLVW